MREILFRGKIKHSCNGINVIDTWVEGSLVRVNENYWDKEPPVINEIITPDATWSYYGEYSAYHAYTVYPETVGEWTGIIDINGKKIFEGDIVQFASSSKYCFEVYRDNDYGGAWKIKNETGIKKLKYYRHRLEKNCEYIVVGNIHDNPELLKENINDQTVS